MLCLSPSWGEFRDSSSSRHRIRNRACRCIIRNARWDKRYVLRPVSLTFVHCGHAEISSLASYQYHFLTMTNGMAIRAGVGTTGVSHGEKNQLSARMMTQVISLVFRKSLRLSGRARLLHSSGQITTLISADATRLDLASVMVHKYVYYPPSSPLIQVFSRPKNQLVCGSIQFRYVPLPHTLLFDEEISIGSWPLV